MNMLLIRHTKTATPAGLCYGRTEVPLADTFPTEAAAVLAALPPPPWRIISSPAERCRRLADYLGHPVQLDERLRELNFGVWENRPWQELPRAETDFWADDYVHRRPTGGESFGELAARAQSFFADHQATSALPLVVVTHAGIIRALLAQTRGLPLAESFNLPVDFGSVHLLSTAAHQPCAKGPASVRPDP